MPLIFQQYTLMLTQTYINLNQSINVGSEFLIKLLQIKMQGICHQLLFFLSKILTNLYFPMLN
jgi:hypothetical protein